MAHLLIVELAGGNDTDLLEAAVLQGHTFSLLTAEVQGYQKLPAVAPQLTRARHLLEIPGFAMQEVRTAVLRVHAKDPFDAVLCLIDIRVIEAAELAALLDCHFVNVQSARLLRDKYSVRQRLQNAGLLQPEFALACSNQEIRSAVDMLGLPVLIKPADGYGSQNIVALKRPEDLDPYLSPLDSMLPSHADYGLGVRANDRLLVERFMQGQLVGCDVMTAAGQHTLWGVNEKKMFDFPSFAIRGSCFTPAGPQHQAIAEYAFQVLDAVGFDWGATHIEIMLTEQGPQLVEINPRLVGARIPRMIDFATGHSVLAALMDLHLGRKRQPPAFTRTQVCVSRWFVSDTEGTLKKVLSPEWNHPGIRCIEWLKQPGDHVRPAFENADRLGYVMVVAETRDDAEALADQVIAQTTVQVIAD